MNQTGGNYRTVSAQFRNKVLRKLLPPQRKSVREVAAEFGISTATIDGWAAKMNDGRLQVDEGARDARHRQLTVVFPLNQTTSLAVGIQLK